MSNFTITLEIPALERLCGLLEDKMIRTVEQAIRGERTEPLRVAPAPVTEPPMAEAAPEPAEGPQEPPKPGPAHPSPAPESPVPAGSPVTLDAVQRAAMQMRDEGKVKAVTDLFPAFGIEKLSDLKGDALQAFGAKLREMGAKL